MLRFAPKLDSDLTLSNLRVAILNYLVAKQNDDRFILRFADIDSDKIIEGKDSEIIQIFEKFAIKDDLRYHQQERQSIHQKLALGLLESNKAYICVCDDSTKECQCQNLDKKSLQEIKESKKPFVIKLNSEFLCLKSKSHKDEKCTKKISGHNLMYLLFIFRVLLV